MDRFLLLLPESDVKMFRGLNINRREIKRRMVEGEY
jgi:hypothetical protein